MKYLAIFLHILLVIAFAERSFSQGSPPLMTDDSGVPGANKWENNIGFVFEGNSEENVFEGPIIDLNYGVGDHIQLKYEMGWIAETGEHFANKFDAILLGVKYNFSNGKEKEYEFSVYPQAAFSFNNESGKNIEYGFILPVMLSKEFDELSANAQLGFEMLGEERNGFYGLSFGKELSESLELLAELHGVFARADEAEEHEFFFNLETFVNIGANIKLTESILINAAVGRKLNTAITPEHGGEYFAYAGLQFLL
jgi:hypothetical protein